MVDPNRKINIDLQSDEESSSSSEDDVLNEEHVQLVKEFEEVSLTTIIHKLS